MHHQQSPVSANAPRRLCLFRLSAIGDCCNMVPIVRTLQAHLPETRLTWIMGQTEAGLLGDLDGVEVITHDKKAGTGTLRRKLSGRAFDVLLLMQVALRAGLVSRAVEAPVRIGFDRSRSRDGHSIFINQRIPNAPPGHVIDGFFGFCEALGVQARHLRWDIPVPNSAGEQAEHLLTEFFGGTSATGDDRTAARGILLISPCSSQRFRNFRNWAPEYYAEVARYAASVHGLRIILTGGKSEVERDYGEQITAALKNPLGQNAPVPVLNLIGRTDLKTLFALMQRASVVLAPDSGPLHMAVAAGTPAVGLYATSNPERTGPVLGMRWVVNAYPQAVRQSLGRSVGDVRWGQRVRDPRAMALIKPAAVIAKLDELMSTPSKDRLAV
ncbi:glycosyltransferase family 9 protein [Spiribacter onubensis]|uniref:glycosyltransferase family 9 protein n=1 Tax=Spiribacter onubensis TaxID=3122420 RepID=UPI0038B67ECA